MLCPWHSLGFHQRSKLHYAELSTSIFGMLKSSGAAGTMGSWIVLSVIGGWSFALWWQTQEYQGHMQTYPLWLRNLRIYSLCCYSSASISFFDRVQWGRDGVGQQERGVVHHFIYAFSLSSTTYANISSLLTVKLSNLGFWWHGCQLGGMTSSKPFPI